jgi:RNA polymerase sigma-70 factor (ECF subfamily)
MEPSPGEITRLLNELRSGNREAEARLIPLVYDELRRQAAFYMRRERPGHTLQPTALVHEAYLRLVEQREVPQNRAHFLAVAAQLMRRILVDYARARQAEKRPPGGQRISLDHALVFSEDRSGELVALDEALGRLTQFDPGQSRIVELRYFGGLSVEETADVTGLSTRQVKREWSFAKAWLRRELTKHA